MADSEYDAEIIEALRACVELLEHHAKKYRPHLPIYECVNRGRAVIAAAEIDADMRAPLLKPPAVVQRELI